MEENTEEQGQVVDRMLRDNCSVVSPRRSIEKKEVGLVIGGLQHQDLSHSYLFPFAWQSQISPSRGSHSRGVYAVPDLRRKVHATEKA